MSALQYFMYDMQCQFNEEMVPGAELHPTCLISGSYLGLGKEVADRMVLSCCSSRTLKMYFDPERRLVVSTISDG